VKDYYAILGVQPDTPDDQLKIAYRKLAMELHPDRNPGNKEAEEKFKTVSEAYEVLRDPQKRAMYEQQRKGGFQPGFNPGRNPGWSHDPFGGGFAFNFDMNGDVFDIMNGVARRRPQNRDLNVEVPITLEELFHGRNYTISFAAPDGTLRDISIDVPAGVSEDARFKCPGKGDHSIKNLPPGDAYVILRPQPHATFQRRAQNLFMAKKINCIEAMVGTTFTVIGIDGTELLVKVPPGTQHNEQLRLQGHGMTVHGIKPRGDLFVIMNVEVPRNLTADQIEKLKDINQPTSV
jgi:DnaJ-class molecular chaperone